MTRDTQIVGQFLQAFLQSAGEVSPVFERRARGFLEDNGIDQVDPNEWYSVERFAAAMNEIETAVGEKTAEQAGIKMIEIIDELQGLDTFESVLETAQVQQRESYQPFSPEAVGQIRYEQDADGTYRLSYYGGWPYPESFTRGIFRGTADATTEFSTFAIESTTTRDDEPFAFRLEPDE